LVTTLQSNNQTNCSIYHHFYHNNRKYL